MTNIEDFFTKANQIAERNLKIANNYVKDFQDGKITYTELGRFLIALHETELEQLKGGIQ